MATSPAASRTVVIVAGGDAPSMGAAAMARGAHLVVAADSGLEHAQRLGLAVDVVVGDMDSVAPEVLSAAEAAGTQVERHPTDKDLTDLELAIECAMLERPAHLLVIGGGGGRLDHLVANVAVLGSPRTVECTVRAAMGDALVHLVRPAQPLELRVDRGELVSLLALHGPVHGVRTDGLRWNLDDETLPSGSARGISNRAIASRCGVHVGAGVLSVVVPHALVPASQPQPQPQSQQEYLR